MDCIFFASALAHFNSIKVQLELLGRCLEPLPSEFQFHKGTIRTHYRYREQSENINFNSIKVQLERPCRHYHRRVLPFQFHKGTIRTF